VAICLRIRSGHRRRNASAILGGLYRLKNLKEVKPTSSFQLHYNYNIFTKDLSNQMIENLFLFLFVVFYHNMKIFTTMIFPNHTPIEKKA
jgi:hypothetical protein